MINAFYSVPRCLLARGVVCALIIAGEPPVCVACRLANRPAAVWRAWAAERMQSIALRRRRRRRRSRQRFVGMLWRLRWGVLPAVDDEVLVARHVVIVVNYDDIGTTASTRARHRNGLMCLKRECRMLMRKEGADIVSRSRSVITWHMWPWARSKPILNRATRMIEIAILRKLPFGIEKKTCL